MNLPLLIARRYLFAKKSHNVINVISAISAIGMAIGTAALVVILSVYNGFSQLVRDSLSSVEPDFKIEKLSSKVFIAPQEERDWLLAQPGIKSVAGLLEENIFISYDGRNSIASARGISADADTAILADKVIDGKFALKFGDVPMAVAGVGLALKTAMNPRLHIPVEMYFPDRHKSISVSNPAASLRKEKAWVSGLFSITSDIDESTLMLPYGTLASLLGYSDGEISSLEVRLDNPGRDASRIKDLIQEHFGDEYSVKDRYAQNETLYKMMKSEKAAVYLILLFVVIIIAFNIFGSLTMLMIEKKDDIETLRSLGAQDKTIRKIFILEGWMISLLGLFAGLVIGLALVILQQQTGIVGMPGAFAVNAYPVILNFGDIALVAVSVAAIGYTIALIPAKSDKNLPKA